MYFAVNAYFSPREPRSTRANIVELVEFIGVGQQTAINLDIEPPGTVTILLCVA